MTFRATEHAVRRYQERVKPQLGEKQAGEELEALADLGQPIPRPEWWMPDTEGGLFLEIAPDAVALVRNACVVTVVTKPFDAAGRAKRNHVKALKRRAKRTSGGRPLRGHGHGRPRDNWEEAA